MFRILTKEADKRKKNAGDGRKEGIDGCWLVSQCDTSVRRLSLYYMYMYVYSIYKGKELLVRTSF